MNLLISQQQVAELAFRAPDFIAPEAIPESTILAAQQKFIKPVFGDLYDAMLTRTTLAEFTSEYVAPPLALYVKMLMLPSLAVQSGAAGVVEVTGKNLARVSDERLRAAIARLRGDAAALIRRAVEHVEADPTRFPEYDPRENILNRVSTEGGVILPKCRMKNVE